MEANKQIENPEASIYDWSEIEESKVDKKTIPANDLAEAEEETKQTKMT